jgi:hypothetical protein
MNNEQPTSKEFEAYQKVNRYLERKIGKEKDDNRFSLFPKPKWLVIIIIALAAFSIYYALTTILFGQDFWVRSITGDNLK